MVMIEEAVLIMMFCALWALGAYALYQRFFVVRRLRKRFALYADAIVVSAPAAQPAATA